MRRKLKTGVFLYSVATEVATELFRRYYKQKSTANFTKKNIIHLFFANLKV